VAGKLTANGGAGSGDGGLIETSGHSLEYISVITLFDGPPSRVFDGLPGTASRAL